MNRILKIIVTGGAGFIGSALVRELIANNSHEVMNVDNLSYAGNLSSLRDVDGNSRYAFRQIDIADAQAVAAVLGEFQPDAVMHLAAESHVDRSIDGPGAFIQTNIVGTYTLLQRSLEYWETLPKGRRETFRFLHVSTDEVYGSLGPTGAFGEETPYDPRSPYSASKAGADHLVMAWFHTYGLPVLMTNCSNNYGPYQFPEKLVPLVILNALDGKALPIYGQGENVRDWLYVEDHVRALLAVLKKATPGQKYNIGSDNQRTNLQVVHAICDALDEFVPVGQGDEISSYRDLIRFVPDRPGHDKRYAIDARKIRSQIGWAARESFETSLRKTVQWYLDNRWWWQPIREQEYAGHRLGLEAST